jgi:hypothetical protein
MDYRELVVRSLERFREAMAAEKWVAQETELVNFYEKRGLIPELLEADPGFDIARICRESHVRNPYHTRAIQKLISRAKPAIDQLQCPVLSGISSDPSVLTGIRSDIGVQILLVNNLTLTLPRSGPMCSG